jgi:hypothetical protein
MRPPPSIAPATTIPEVIEAISGFADWCQINASRLGYFAALYLRITKTVEAGLLVGTVFQNNERMTQLDVTFANRYLSALNSYFYPENSPGLSKCWHRCFVGAETSGDTIVQYMLSGVAAHIGLDLGVAAQQVCGSRSNLQAFQGDFDRINTVLSDQVQTVLSEIDTESPILGDLYQVLGKHEVALIDESLGGSRDMAWALSLTLASEDRALRDATIAVKDSLVAGVVDLIYSPLEPLESIAQLIVQKENQNVPEVIAKLLSSEDAIGKTARKISHGLPLSDRL